MDYASLCNDFCITSYIYFAKVIPGYPLDKNLIHVIFLNPKKSTSNFYCSLFFTSVKLMFSRSFSKFYPFFFRVIIMSPLSILSNSINGRLSSLITYPLRIFLVRSKFYKTYFRNPANFKGLFQL